MKQKLAPPDTGRGPLGTLLGLVTQQELTFLPKVLSHFTTPALFLLDRQGASEQGLRLCPAQRTLQLRDGAPCEVPVGRL